LLRVCVCRSKKDGELGAEYIYRREEVWGIFHTGSRGILEGREPSRGTCEKHMLICLQDLPSHHPYSPVINFALQLLDGGFWAAKTQISHHPIQSLVTCKYAAGFFLCLVLTPPAMLNTGNAKKLLSVKPNLGSTSSYGCRGRGQC
jgi:hypothetical protein